VWQLHTPAPNDPPAPKDLKRGKLIDGGRDDYVGLISCVQLCYSIVWDLRGLGSKTQACILGCSPGLFAIGASFLPLPQIHGMFLRSMNTLASMYSICRPHMKAQFYYSLLGELLENDLHFK
jgi:hypothetical protein